MNKVIDLARFVSIILMIISINSSCKKDRANLSPGSIKIESFLLDPVFPRTGQNSTLTLVLQNMGSKLPDGKIQLLLPGAVEIAPHGKNEIQFSDWKTLDTKTVQFNLISHSSSAEKITVNVLANMPVPESFIELKWNPAVSLLPYSYTPEPITDDTGNYLIGVQRCDLWNVPGVWNIYKQNYPDRQPVIGWYDEGESDVTDWEIKYAVEHGISFFMHCWYRDPNNFGLTPIQTQYDQVIKSYSTCRYADKIKFAIEWINTQTTTSGVSGTDDLVQNLLPFWIENYFKKSNYLKIDNKPVLIIFGPDGLIKDLGGESNTRSALAEMRNSCISAGFSGLILIGQYCWGASTNPNSQFKTIGLDFTSSYHWPSFGQVLVNSTNPTGPEIIQGQKTCWKNQSEFGSLPNLITCSMGWDSSPWGGMTSSIKWRLTPDEFQTVLQNAKEMMDTRITGSLENRVVLLDNWNEYGEGHYIFPTRQFGFGYLDAVRKVFSTTDQIHTDIVPEDVGLSLNMKEL